MIIIIYNTNNNMYDDSRMTVSKKYVDGMSHLPGNQSIELINRMNEDKCIQIITAKLHKHIYSSHVPGINSRLPLWM
jgi:hypothetical protein